MRLAGTDWDQGSYLHPDERHLMFVLTLALDGLAESEPGAFSWLELWFASGTSPLDPRRDGALYVYGEFPHLATALIALASGTSGWPSLLQLGRTLVAVIDSATIVAVFLTGIQIFRSNGAALVAAAFYCCSPLALQLSNFFAVDVWLAGAAAWCLFAATMAVRAVGERVALKWLMIAGALSGLGLACKLPGILLGGVVAAAALSRFFHTGARPSLGWLALAGGLSAAAALITFRLAAPFTFAGPGLLDLSVNPHVISGYGAMRDLIGNFGFPPSWQWMKGYGALEALRDLAIWGVGSATVFAVMCGAAGLAMNRASWRAAVPCLVLVGVFAAYWLGSHTPALRYVLPAVSALCILAGGAALLLPRSVVSLMVILALMWGTGMVALHAGTHTRVEASRWLWAHFPAGTVIATESAWDEGLPVAIRQGLSGERLHPSQDDHFEMLQLGLEGPDSLAKVDRIVSQLAQVDLLAISSERLRRPILKLADRFPMTAAYYQMLESGELCFELIYEGRRGYSVLGYEFDDSEAQEPWSVYDHPRVEIYSRSDCFDAGRLRSRLVQALGTGG